MNFSLDSRVIKLAGLLVGLILLLNVTYISSLHNVRESRPKPMLRKGDIVQEGHLRGAFVNGKPNKRDDIGVWGTFPLDRDNTTHTLLIGIFSKRELSDRRQVLRDTWLSNPFVCPYKYRLENISIDPKSGYPCIIYYAFVYGNTEVDEYDGISIPIHENMNDGKSFTWFNYCSEHFSDLFTYFGKTEMDTYVYSSELAHLLQQLHGNYLYYGRIRGRPRRSLELFNACMRMTSELYFFSKDLVDWIHTSISDLPKSGPEDMVTASWLCVHNHPLLFYGNNFSVESSENDSLPWNYPVRGREEVQMYHNSPRAMKGIEMANRIRMRYFGEQVL